MRLSNPKLLKQLRAPGRCRWCSKWCAVREPAHVFGVGAYGRIDAEWNLVQLGSSVLMCCACHRLSHDGKTPTMEDLLAISAADHGCLQDEIRDAVHLIARLDKSCEHDPLWTAREWLERYGEAKRG